MNGTAAKNLEFDNSEAEEAARKGRELLTRVTLMLRLAAIYDLANEAMQPAIDGARRAVNVLVEEVGEIAIQIMGENIFLNREVLKLTSTTFEVAQQFRVVMRRLAVGEIAFKSELTEEDCRAFLAVFQDHYRSRTPENFQAEKFSTISVRVIDKATEDALAGQIDTRQNVVRTYALVMLAIEDVIHRLEVGKPPRLSQLRRAIQGLADASKEHASLVIGLTRSPNLRGTVAQHLTAVAALTLLMGRKLGLSKRNLCNLAMAGALHDVGRNDMAAPDAEALQEELNKVPVRSVLAICKSGVTKERLLWSTVACENHRPMLEDQATFQPSAFARLVAVPCTFDLLTATTLGGKAILPDQALRLIQDQAGKRFDERVTRLFTSLVGLYPVGTTVKLSGGQLAVVTEVPADPADFIRPRVKVIRENGNAADYLLDLKTADPNQRIVETVDAVEEAVNVSHFLLA
jgi:HD-GYP domain-containing protein (c-di-GMP phosphodiesterase class II)